MKVKEIQVCGKIIRMTYCYATEISYKILAGEPIDAFIREVIDSMNQQQMPDIRKSIYLILAAMSAYYDQQGQDAPITDKDLMYDCTAKEMGEALGTIIVLRGEFYAIPTDEPKDKEEEGGGDSKNA